MDYPLPKPSGKGFFKGGNKTVRLARFRVELGDELPASRFVLAAHAHVENFRAGPV